MALGEESGPAANLQSDLPRYSLRVDKEAAGKAALDEREGVDQALLRFPRLLQGALERPNQQAESVLQAEVQAPANRLESEEGGEMFLHAGLRGLLGVA